MATKQGSTAVGGAIVRLEKASAISLEGSLAVDTEVEKAILTIPRGDQCDLPKRCGRAAPRSDGLYETDCFLTTKPIHEWSMGREALEKELRERLDGFDDVEVDLSQPIDMRVSEMLTGVRAAVAVKLFGDDFDVLEEKAGQIQDVAEMIEGASDIFRARLSGQAISKSTFARSATTGVSSSSSPPRKIGLCAFCRAGRWRGS